MARPIDYSKWDNIDTDSDEEEAAGPPRKVPAHNPPPSAVPPKATKAPTQPKHNSHARP